MFVVAGFAPATSFRGAIFRSPVPLLQRPISPVFQVAHCRIRLKSMMLLNHRRWPRLAANADKCERRRRKNKVKAGLERQIRAVPGRSNPCQGWAKRGVAGLYDQVPGTDQKLASISTGGNTLMRKLLIAAAAAAIFVAPGIASAQSPIVIKFSHVVAPNTPKGKGADKFKELAEKYTNGKVKVEVYPNSTLYKDKEELEALQLGAVQMLAPSNSKFGPIGIKDFEVFDLPYLLPNKAALRKVTEGPIGQNMLKKLDSKGMVGLAYWDNGFKQMSANKPLRMPEDYKGLKFRIQSSKVLEAQFRALGAVPQVMAFSEVYQALQTGVVDGQENT